MIGQPRAWTDRGGVTVRERALSGKRPSELTSQERDDRRAGRLLDAASGRRYEARQRRLDARAVALHSGARRTRGDMSADAAAVRVKKKEQRKKRKRERRVKWAWTPP